MFWFHNTHPERMQKQTNKKQPRCKKIQEQERKIVPINGMTVKRGEKRLKKREKWKYRLMLCENRKMKAKSSQMKDDKLQI